MRFLHSAVLGCLALVLPALLSAATESGALDSAKPCMGALFPLELRDDSLSVNLEKLATHESPHKGKRDQMFGSGIGDAFQDVLEAGCDIHESSSAMGADTWSVTAETQALVGRAKLHRTTAEPEYAVSLEERQGPKRKLEAELHHGQLKVRLTGDDVSFKFLQKPGGALTLEAQRGEQKVRLDAANLTALLKAHADKTQVFFLRPLADLGVILPPHRYLPPVMAVATGAFDPPPPEVAQKANELIAALSADDMDVRENACRELIALFPRAIFHISQAAQKAQDAEVKASLNKVVAAHPGIAKARAFVEKEKLHENREYLLDLLANVPFFKAAARARLTVLLGKDYGDDAAQWPK
jgi:hypothetical protein